MRRGLIVLVLIVLGGYFGFILFNNYIYSEKQAPETPKCEEVLGELAVSMGEEGYSPKDFEIRRCTRVTFTNNSISDKWPASDLHPTHGIYPEFDPQRPILPGETWSFVFSKAGGYGYHDHTNPSIRGSITVLD